MWSSDVWYENRQFSSTRCSSLLSQTKRNKVSLFANKICPSFNFASKKGGAVWYLKSKVLKSDWPSIISCSDHLTDFFHPLLNRRRVTPLPFKHRNLKGYIFKIQRTFDREDTEFILKTIQVSCLCWVFIFFCRTNPSYNVNKCRFEELFLAHLVMRLLWLYFCAFTRIIWSLF